MSITKLVVSGLAVLIGMSNLWTLKGQDMAMNAKGMGLTLLGAMTLSGEPYDDQYKKLKDDLLDEIPSVSSSRKSDYLDAVEAEKEALAALRESEKKMGEINRAKALVEHAKGKWIGDADKGIAETKAALEKAESRDEREKLEKQLADWEQNREDGEKALEERTRNWERIKSDQPQVERAIEDAKEGLADAKAATQEALGNLGIASFLSSNALDGKLAKFVALHEADPDVLEDYAEESAAHRKRIDAMLANEALLIQMAVADGPRDANYPRAMKIYEDIQKASPKASTGVLQRLALAVSLEHATERDQRNAVADAESPGKVDPLKRYLHFEQAYLNGELDPHFKDLTVWDLRMVVDGEEPVEILAWGREMLRTYRPDHITTKDNRWRYVGLVRSDIRYGSQENKYDKDELQFFQNILMNGGICGRRAFIGRFILRAFGNPTTARPQRGHAALVRWTPDGWVPVLGAGWGSGWTKGKYDRDLNFLATTQARALGDHFMKVKRAHWVGDVMGEKMVYGLVSARPEKAQPPEFWNGVALYTQRALIADKEALGAAGEELGEANESEAFVAVAAGEVTDADREVSVDNQGVVTIPAAATSEPNQSTGRITFMPSANGGLQLLHARNGQKQPFEYTVKAPKSGTYNLVAKVATPSWKQNLIVSVNDKDNAATIPLPHTVGLWGHTVPVKVELKSGKNVIRFSHESVGITDKGFAIKEFKLVPDGVDVQTAMR